MKNNMSSIINTTLNFFISRKNQHGFNNQHDNEFSLFKENNAAAIINKALKIKPKW